MRRVTFLIVGVCLAGLAAEGLARAGCDRPPLKQERRDSATILRLETAWTRAYLTGDTELEACLLAPDFTAIMSDGKLLHLPDELSLAAKNRGKAATDPPMPPITVLLHGNVAVAHGVASRRMVHGRLIETRYADYYVWKDGAWQVFFAQQTSYPLASGAGNLQANPDSGE